MMQKFLRCILLFAPLIPQNGFAQSDSVRIASLLEFVTQNRQDSVASFDSLGKAKEIAYLSEDPQLLGLTELYHGIIYYLYEDHDRSLEYYERAMEGFTKAGDTFHIAKTERLIGIQADAQGRIADAREHINKALELYRAIDNKSGVAECYLSMAVLQQRTNKIDEALYAYKRALDIAIEAGKPPGFIASVYNNIGSVYQIMGMYDSSRKYLMETIRIRTETGDFFGLGPPYHNLGTLEFEVRNYELALKYYKIANEHRHRTPDNEEAISGLLCIGRTFIYLAQYDSAQYYLDKAYNWSITSGTLLRVMESYDFLADLEEHRGNYKKALDHYKNYKLFSDSVALLSHQFALSELETKFNYQARVEENEELKTAQAEIEGLLRKNQKALMWLILLVICLLAGVLALVVNTRRIRKTKKELEDLNRRLKDQTAELTERNEQMARLMHDKSDLISVMAHDLRSPFSKIHSIANLIRSSEDAEESSGYFRLLENISRDGLGLIQDLIDFSRLDEYQNIANQPERLRKFKVSEVFDRLVVSFRSNLESKNLRIELDLNDEEALNREEFCERVCDNLLSNAIKYSYPDGLIRVKSYVFEDQMHIEIEDNGPGFKEGDLDQLYTRFARLSARPTGMENSTGLGLYIAKQLAKAMGGDIELISEVEKPAKFRLLFPVRSEVQTEAQTATPGS